jgi:hypothetical protein
MNLIIERSRAHRPSPLRGGWRQPGGGRAARAELVAPPHPALRATFSHVGEKEGGGPTFFLLPSWEKVPEGRMRGLFCVESN